MNNHFTGIGCLQGTNIVHYIFAFIGIFLVLLFGMIINVIYVDTYRCKNIKARYYYIKSLDYQILMKIYLSLPNLYG
jgi:hypothetical protein